MLKKVTALYDLDLIKPRIEKSALNKLSQVFNKKDM